MSHIAQTCYRSKAKNAQEAHEAIRPTKAGRLPNQAQLPKGSQLARLYSLIWARALASQMSAAQLLQVSAHLLTHCLHWLEQGFCVCSGLQWSFAGRESHILIGRLTCKAVVHV